MLLASFGSLCQFSRALVDLLSGTRPSPHLLSKRTNTVWGLVIEGYVSFLFGVLGIEPRPPSDSL